VVVTVFRPIAAAIGHPVIAHNPHVMMLKNTCRPWFAPRFTT
jgi:hypothetical protein